jgi:hypothetical protein
LAAHRVSTGQQTNHAWKLIENGERREDVADLEAVNDPAELYTARGLLHDILSVYSECTGFVATAIQQAIGLEYLPPRSHFPGESRLQYQRFAEGAVDHLNGTRQNLTGARLLAMSSAWASARSPIFSANGGRMDWTVVGFASASIFRN